MASLRTEITEIVTGLGMLGLASVDEALAARPEAMVGVEGRHYERLGAARADGKYEVQFEEAWANGVAFAAADDGLRGRQPRRVEWKGPHQAPSYEQTPADLRIDHVYLVSCKYGSRLLHNVSPGHLFDRLLAVRQGSAGDWYAEVALAEYQALYGAAREFLADHEEGFDDLPSEVGDLSADQHKRLKRPFARRWPEPLAEAAHWFSVAVSQASAERWLKALGRRATPPGGGVVAPAAAPACALLRVGHRPPASAGALSGGHPLGLPPAVRVPSRSTCGRRPGCSRWCAGGAI